MIGHVNHVIIGRKNNAQSAIQVARGNLLSFIRCVQAPTHKSAERFRCTEASVCPSEETSTESSRLGHWKLAAIFRRVLDDPELYVCGSLLHCCQRIPLPSGSQEKSRTSRQCLPDN